MYHCDLVRTSLISISVIRIIKNTNTSFGYILVQDNNKFGNAPFPFI